MRNLITSIALMMTIATPAMAQDSGSTLQELMSTLNGKAAMIFQGMVYEDFDLIADSAVWVYDHGKPTNMGKVVKVLGADMAEFKRVDRIVHDAAIAIVASAKVKDLDSIADNYAIMSRNCIACHQQFRDRVREVTSED